MHRLYLVGVNDDSFGGSSASFTPYALGRYLKEHYSEIEDYCLFEAETFFVLKDNRMLELPMLLPDTTALRMLDIRALEMKVLFVPAPQITVLLLRRRPQNSCLALRM